MRWQDKCVNELLKRNLFLSIVHLERFEQILQRVKEEPFFTKGVCKCLFLLSWEPEKASQVQEILMEMKDRGESEKEYLVQSAERLFPNEQLEQVMKQLFLEFLTKEGETPDENVLLGLSFTRIDIGDNALEASRVIDSLSTK
ncbi:MAG: hypothetical protein KH355_09900 [Clostridiales bacterium]|nr:hypothetical protein [Clostridiales bacterium]